MNKLCLNSRDELLMIDLDQVAYLQANGNYTQFMYIAGKGPLVSLGLSKIEQYISRAWPSEQRSPLVRLGRSLIINQRFLTQINVIQQRLVLSDNAGHNHILVAPKPLLKQYKELAEASRAPPTNNLPQNNGKRILHRQTPS